MIQRASVLGELASRILARGKSGRVTRSFPSSAYVRSGSDFVVLLWGELRSPLTVNLRRGGGAAHFTPGRACTLSEAGIESEGTTIEVAGAEIFRASLLGSGTASFPPTSALSSGVRMIRSLYDVASAGPKLPDDGAFRHFVDAVLTPLAAGRRIAVHDQRPYRDLVGRGGGFTPAGDDFIGGFVATYNFVARRRRWERIAIPRRMLSTLTVPESAAILGYAARGYVDELMERLILRSIGPGGAPFHRELLAVAHRGHTSGIDMGLGVLLCEAALAETEGNAGALAACLQPLWNS